MERFPGIFIVATNLFKGLDPAALRRFTFKLEFQAMAPSQRLRMFLTETGIIAAGTIVDPAQLEAWNMKLTMMPMLTAGDFATVKRQTVLLGETLTPEDWINQLQIECATKAK
jgi:SpoVK/Ycf46/Vps4 family AAA+-type ATPase